MNTSLKPIIALGLLSVLVISVSGCTAQTSGDKLSFITGTSHPADVAALLKKGPVLLYFGGNCTACAEQKVIISHLESQYKGTEVTILRIDPFIDKTGKATNYGVRTIPETIVIRTDGAVAKSVGLTDEQTLKNTIEEARNWK